MAVPASPPLRMTVPPDDRCDGCRLPVYRCQSEEGQMLRLCASHLRWLTSERTSERTQPWRSITDALNYDIWRVGRKDLSYRKARRPEDLTIFLLGADVAPPK
jgi:hypothetical protein